MYRLPEQMFTAACPRCDRTFTVTTDQASALARVEAHVKLAHPDYDPDWINE